MFGHARLVAGATVALASLHTQAANDLVISQIYGGGGNSGATYRQDFIELFNRGTGPIALDGWSVQYASASGSTWNNKTLLGGTLEPGQYFLIQQAQGAGGSVDLPAPDALGAIAMSATNGKVALVASTTDLAAGTTCPTGPDILDFVGYGSANCSETTPVAALSNTTAALRANGGATDSDNNNADFAIAGPTPRNSTTTSALLALIASDASANEFGSDAGAFTLTRIGGNTALALAVNVQIGGTAVNGTDYLPALSSPVTIPAGQTALVLTLTPDDDASAEGSETVLLTLIAGAGYAVGQSATATVTIGDDDVADSAPAVSGTTPANGASNVALTTPVSVSFTEQVDLASGAVRVECPSGSVVASSGAAANVASFAVAPSGAWPVDTNCVVRVISSGVGDVDATDPPNAPAADFSSSFNTVATACTAADTTIGAIQGPGTSAALTGVRTVQGVVVADYEGADPALRGFYLQNTPAGADGSAATSDGIFIFNQNANSVALGQVVQVTGNVSEYGFNSTGGTQTQVTAQTIEACGMTAEVAPVDVTLPTATSTELERYEGMLVRFPQSLSVTEHFQLGRFGQVLLSVNGRLPQPTSIAAPGAPALAQQSANGLHQIMLDDGDQQQNAEPIRYARSGAALSATNSLRGGDTVSGVRGVLTQTDATAAGNVPANSDPVRYRLRPFSTLAAENPHFIAGNLRPGLSPSRTGSVRVAGFNLLNYFNTFGTTACNNGLGGTVAECRGAESTAEFERQWPKTIAAALGATADILVVNEIENDGYGPGSALADLVARLNAASAPGTYAYIDADSATGQVNSLGTDAIKVGIVYRPARVTPVGTTAVANTAAFGLYTTSGGSTQRNRPALAQAFAENGTPARIVVVANHLKSKGSACDDNLSPVGPDPDAGDGQGNCNLTRTAAAAQLMNWLAADPTASGSANVLVMGDLNAYAKEDPVAALTGAGYVDLVADRLGPLAYSYVFDGQWGYLDHALASSALAPQVIGVDEWHINADEPNVLDYNTNFKSVTQLAELYAADAFRASDHDLVLIDLSLDSDGDGLADTTETALGTDPRDADHDDDGLADGAEDANHDGLVNAGETDPRSRDSDIDGVQDGTEAGLTTGIPDPDDAGPLSGTDLAFFVPDADPTNTTDPARADSDSDGVVDGAEDLNGNGALDTGETDPNDAGSGAALHQVPFAPGWALLGLSALLAARVAQRATGGRRQRRAKTSPLE